MTYKNTNRRDTNETPIVDLWRRCGCVCIQLHPGQSADWIVAARNGIHIVEIKTHLRHWTLTDDEKRLQAALEALGLKLEIVETMRDAVELIGQIPVDYEMVRRMDAVGR
jgi:hypothetical protein